MSRRNQTPKQRLAAERNFDTMRIQGMRRVCRNLTDRDPYSAFESGLYIKDIDEFFDKIQRHVDNVWRAKKGQLK